MKERVSFTFDKETVDVIDKLVSDGRYRNKSHLVESAIRSLEKREFGSFEGEDE